MVNWAILALRWFFCRDGHCQRIMAAGVTALAVAGCSGTAGLTTASPAPPAVVDDSATRVAQVSWTSARAEKCGFVLDQERLKANYLAYEGSRGSAPETMPKVDQAYTVSRKIQAARIAASPDYCSGPIVEEVRADLARYLAGDYSARARVPISEE